MASDDLKHIYDISLFNISDLDVLLHEILKYTRELLQAEAGTIYIKDKNYLKFHVFQNDALSYENIYRFYHSTNEYKLSLEDKGKYIALDSFLTKKIIMIDDVYDSPGYAFVGAKEFDKKFNYKTHSTISVPLIHPINQKVIGVVQLLNKKENDNYSIFTVKDKEVISTISAFISLSVSKAQDDVAKLHKLNKELEKSNAELERKIEEKIIENQNKSAIIFHQSKMASMGEMIGNIAHQWRQPLSTISTLASGISMNLKIGGSDIQRDIMQLNKIVDTTKTLSKTIDDFRDFYNVDTMDENFNIAESIKKSIEIAESEILINDINIIMNLDNSLYIYGLKNEFTQCILNLLTTAKDSLASKVPISEKRYIFIDLFEEENNKICLNIKDNGRGIDSSNINNEASGVGLFLTKLIIEKHMKGSLSVENKEFSYQDKHFYGAFFTINLPG